MNRNASINNSDVISVNPGRKTLGALNLQSATRFLRTTITLPSNRRKSANRKTLDVLFAVASPSFRQRSGCIIVLRFFFAVLLGLCAFMPMYFDSSLEFYHMGVSHIAVIAMIAGVASLVLGLFIRPVMIAVALILAAESALQFSVGDFDETVLFCVFGCVLFAVTGSGKYSVDYLVRRLLLRSPFSEKRKRKLEKKRLSYEAYRYRGR